MDKNTKIALAVLAAGFLFHELSMWRFGQNLDYLKKHADAVDQMAVDFIFNDMVENYDEDQ